MEKMLISVVIEKDLYKKVKKWCVSRDIKIKEFITAAIHTELELEGANAKKN